ncbi:MULTISPECIES: type VII secretion protein EccE [Mycobacterium]|uniref:ESX-1 secretion system protein EccE1 n=2 Tax=Mycobacterium kiyosense TaxID=2871094 RepID=A0A9P3QBD5_9MYCO|nr:MULTISPECIES: type VII secretion protein EccE [Mycobacterium]BDE11392.1 ESX-1 secretion system protein EccE1 [Mycobacterium sp. 20KCMC460]GLB86321.1 ESX-1 secretion system protein EccE1 [Mycobacterium kiyosense]GLB92730.1 ESX-1 secretion system protein EccE1 [Mycobacterium kiyosense]GLB98381.1 ESX-1 secretion system protein EccE1 [Mycobacterium kiyosense]GLC04971.1 ESX-1 secretion system protein EccE1 [Mycobacterium kiyosense]
MRNPVRLRFTTGHTVVLTVLAPLATLVFAPTRYWWVGIVLVAVGAVVVFVTFFDRRLTGWVATVFAWLRRRRKPPDVPSEPEVGATVKPGDHVAVRWRRDHLIAVIELRPRPFTPTVIVDGVAHTDDVLDTRLLEQLLEVHCPEMEADVVSAGFRVGRTAAPDVVSLYQRVIGADPAPANRRTWIMLRADPERTRRAAQRRDEGVAGLARYLVASATRIADDLASHGVDAVCGRSFDDYDHAIDIGFVREKWSMIKGRDSYTAAYTALGGPDQWWSARADHTVTRVRIRPGEPPQATVLLTTAGKPKTPRGFTRLFGGQRPALTGQDLVTNRHCQIPIGSAGVLVGETVHRCPVYLPFDDVDVSLNLGDAQAFTQFVVRAAAAGATVTVGAHFEEFARLVGAQVGSEAKVAWPNATTYLGPHPGVDKVVLRHNLVRTPRHRELPIRRVSPPEESRFALALPK